MGFACRRMEGGGFSGVFGVGKSLSERESLCVSVCVSVSVRERERVGEWE